MTPGQRARRLVREGRLCLCAHCIAAVPARAALLQQAKEQAFSDLRRAICACGHRGVLNLEGRCYKSCAKRN